MFKKIIIVFLFVSLPIIIFIYLFTQTDQKTIPSQPIVTTNPCIKSGCSGQLCLSKEDNSNIASTCEWQDSYACYKNAECKLQSNNKCGFTQTSELNNCLHQKPALNKPTN